MHTIELGDERLSEMNASEKMCLVEQFVHVLKKKRSFPFILTLSASIFIFLWPSSFLSHTSVPSLSLFQKAIDILQLQLETEFLKSTFFESFIPVP